MKCPICNAWTNTLETRTHDKENLIWRRKECGNMHTFVTIEQPVENPPPRPNNRKEKLK